jgi:hypothetical protein
MTPNEEQAAEFAVYPVSWNRTLRRAKSFVEKKVSGS